MRNFLFASFVVLSLSAVCGAESEDLNTVLKNARPRSPNAQHSNQAETKKVQKLGFKKMDTVKEINGQQVDSPQKAMELYNQMKANDLATVERRRELGTRCVPNITPGTQGQVDGFKCFQINRESALGKAGLADGDIVISVDGEKVNSPESASRLLSEAESKPRFEILVVRNGREEVLRSVQ